MVSFLATIAVSTAACAALAQGLEVGEYSRPSGAQVSGFVGATTPFVRSPCPALNTLANHGYLPRDGRNITRDMLKTAIKSVYNIGEEVATTLANGAPALLSLSDLSLHDLIEHDASLAHADSYYKNDPAALDATLWADLLSRAKDGKFGVVELAGARKNRMELCKAKPVGCDFGAKQRFIALGESTLVLRAMGGNNDESCSVEFATSFFVDERLPTGYTKPPTPITLPQVLATAAEIQILAPFQ
jgi:hypothetical protein